jgi:ferrous iron transport protein B
MGRIGKVIEPVFAPIGIDWRGSVALLTGFVAKEIVVSTMGILYAADQKDSKALENALVSSGMTSTAALAMMVFVLLYMPCLATLSAIRRETASLKWMIFSISYSTVLAWIMAFLVYQGGNMIGA